MNEAQRVVLQRHIKQLADDIMITEELLAMMYQRKIFERGMIEAIKVRISCFFITVRHKKTI